jgi:hypothetical protein
MKKIYINPETIVVENVVVYQIIAASIRNISGDANLEIGNPDDDLVNADVKASSNLWDIEW